MSGRLLLFVLISLGYIKHSDVVDIFSLFVADSLLRRIWSAEVLHTFIQYHLVRRYRSKKIQLLDSCLCTVSVSIFGRCPQTDSYIDRALRRKFVDSRQTVAKFISLSYASYSLTK